jgi:thiol-disulfide isomerase/thioredoxin
MFSGLFQGTTRRTIAMKRSQSLLFSGALCLMFALPARTEPIGPQVAGQSNASALHRVWRDTADRARPVLPSGTCRLVVLIFLRQDCPITNATLPALETLHRELGAKGVTIIGVHCDEELDAAAARTHAKEYGMTFPVLLDPRHELAKATGATITPEAAVLDPRGRVPYLGRINNLFSALGKRRPIATTHDLSAALHALLEGRAPPAAKTKAVGCYITNR